jgi:hypothetical protein
LRAFSSITVALLICWRARVMLPPNCARTILLDSYRLISFAGLGFRWRWWWWWWWWWFGISDEDRLLSSVFGKIGGWK